MAKGVPQEGQCSIEGDRFLGWRMTNHLAEMGVLTKADADWTGVGTEQNFKFLTTRCRHSSSWTRRTTGGSVFL